MSYIQWDLVVGIMCIASLLTFSVWLVLSSMFEGEEDE